MRYQITRPKGWKHDRWHFYKYVSFAALESILTTASLRWSRPSRFNDPFDIQARFFAPAATDIAREACAIASDLPANNTNVADPRRSRLISALKYAAQTHSPDQYADICRRIGDAVPNYALGVVEELSETARTTFATCHVLCLTTDPDNLTMWAHYADAHQGAVLQFSCIPELNSVWGAAEPVRYSEDFPSLGSAREWAERFWGFHPEVTASEMLDRFVLTKSNDWHSENEWRIIDHLDSKAEFSDVPFPRPELTQVILGMRMSPDNRQQIEKLVQAGFPHCDLIEARPHSTRFGLQLSQIST